MVSSNSQRLAVLGLLAFKVEGTGFSTIQIDRSIHDLPPGAALGALSMSYFTIGPRGSEFSPRNSQQHQEHAYQAPSTNTVRKFHHVNNPVHADWVSSIVPQINLSKELPRNGPVEQLLYGSILRSQSYRLLHDLFERPLFAEAYAEYAADALEPYCRDRLNWTSFESLEEQIALVRDSLKRDAVPKRPTLTQDVRTYLYQSQRRFAVRAAFAIRKCNSSRGRKAWSKTLTDEGIFQAAWQVSVWLKAVHASKDTDPYCQEYYQRLAHARNITLTAKKQYAVGFRLDRPVFEASFEALKASWGLAPGHEGACLLLSDTWSESPQTIADRFDATHDLANQKQLLSTTLSKWCEAGGLEFGATRSEKGAARSFVVLRAMANGLFQHQLNDNEEEALDSGRDASHLCHEWLCVIHLVHEPKKYNIDRISCHKYAIRRRQMGEFIPAECRGSLKIHNPPCMLQLAALTTEERFYIQMNLLRQVRGLEPKKIETPNDFGFSKFLCTAEEAALALVQPGDENTIAASLLQNNPEAGAREMRSGRETVKCGLCNMSFNMAAFYFRHVLHEHGGGVTASRRIASLEEMQRGANAWLEKRSVINVDNTKGTRLAEYLAQENATYEGFVRYYEYITQLHKDDNNGMHYTQVMAGPEYQFVRQDLQKSRS